MKLKHRSLTAVIIMIGIVFISAGYVWYDIQSDVNEIAYAAPMAPVQINVPGSDDVTSMRQLSSKLKAFSLPKELPSGPVPLELFGYHRPDQATASMAADDDAMSDKVSHLLTFTFSSGRRRYCIIDNAFYSLGETLPDGARIIQIDAHKVLIRKNELQFWIPLADPLDMAGNQSEAQSLSKKGDAER